MINVLVLDDDVYVGRLHEQYVNDVPGFRALEPVRDLRAAREALETESVDLLLADYVLPDGTGVELLRETSVDAIVLSAVADPQIVRMALRSGALSYLLKPFEPSQLEALLRRYARYVRAWNRDRMQQADIDTVLRSLHDPMSHSGGHSRGTGPSTSDRVFAALEAAATSLTAMDVATVVGISRATAQRHLAKLAESRSVVVSLHYGSTGRPEHLYGVD